MKVAHSATFGSAQAKNIAFSQSLVSAPLAHPGATTGLDYAYQNKQLLIFKEEAGDQAMVVTNEELLQRMKLFMYV